MAERPVSVPNFSDAEIDAIGALTGAVIRADRFVGIGMSEVNAASLAGRVWAELAFLGYTVRPLAADPYVEAADAEYAERSVDVLPGIGVSWRGGPSEQEAREHIEAERTGRAAYYADDDPAEQDRWGKP